MDLEQRQHLQQLTAQFYDAHADSFDESRKGAWTSWNVVLEQMLSVTPVATLLDVGCGNGRFADFLNSNAHAHISYVGIDSEPAFVASAQQRYPDKTFNVDTLEHALESRTKYDAIVTFGVAHHIPGSPQRQLFIDAIASSLKPGGVAALSFWQPAKLKNFQSKVSPSHSFEWLEANDYLLGWQGTFDHVRYCHHFDEAEIEKLIANSPMQIHTQFQGMGNDETNRYVIARN